MSFHPRSLNRSLRDVPFDRCKSLWSSLLNEKKKKKISCLQSTQHNLFDVSSFRRVRHVGATKISFCRTLRSSCVPVALQSISSEIQAFGHLVRKLILQLVASSFLISRNDFTTNVTSSFVLVSVCKVSSSTEFPVGSKLPTYFVSSPDYLDTYERLERQVTWRRQEATRSRNGLLRLKTLENCRINETHGL